MPIISIPKQLREKLGDDASESLVEMLNQYSLDNRESIIESATQRYETTLAHEMSQLKSELKTDIFEIREDMTRIDHSIRSDFGEQFSGLREDITRVAHSIRSDLGEQISGLSESMTRVDQSIRKDLGDQISTLRETIYRNNATNMKWMFIFWIGQIGAILGFLFAFFS